MLRGMWCIPEIQKAIEVGYQLVKIHEVWHFPEEQQRSGLFQGYVDTWLKIKQESGEWPRWCTDDDTKQQYLTRYKEHEGIELNREAIQKNPGRKATTKLMLNSFWGKFGERQNKPCTKTVHNPSQFYNYLFNPVFEVSTLRICKEDVLEVVYTSNKDNIETSNKTKHFCGCLYNLLGTPKTVQLSTTVATTSALL